MGRSLSQAASGPLPFLSPRAKPAQLLSFTPRLFSRTARLGSARKLTPNARTRNGDGREPEQPVHLGLPPRPLVTTKNFFPQTLCSEINVMFFDWSLVCSRSHTSPHTHSYTSITSLSPCVNQKFPVNVDVEHVFLLHSKMFIGGLSWQTTQGKSFFHQALC